MATRAQLKAEARERQAAIIQLRSQGLRYKDIAKQYDINESRAYQIWKEGIRRIGEPVIARERTRALEVRDLALRKLWTKEQNPPPSRIIQHKDGTVETTLDPDYHTRLLAEIRKWEEHSARLLGLYSGIEVKVENIQGPTSYDQVIAALRAVLLRQIDLSEPLAATEEPAIETQATDITPAASQVSPADTLRQLISSHSPAES